MSFLYYNSRSPSFKRPFGALKAGEQAEFRLRLPKDASSSNPRMLLFRADAWDAPQVIPLALHQIRVSCNYYSCTISLPTPQLAFYCFEVDCGGRAQRILRGADGLGVMFDGTAQLWQLTIYDAGFQTPDFLKGGLIYQIFPDRFCFSGEQKNEIPLGRTLHQNWDEMPEYLPNAQGEITNSDYFCGDLSGVLSKLDYLADLGVTCIYFNPVFEAHSSHRYNTADYMNVDPLLGTEEDLSHLCQEAKKRGISIVLDGVFSHTGDDSVYFNRLNRYPGVGAYNSQQSPYYNWYEFKKWPDEYAAWWGFITLPNVRETNPEYLEFICGENGVLRHWLSLGVAGFRLDVADELPDEFLDALTRCVKEYDSQAIVLGEVWEDASNKVAYGVRRRYFLGQQLDSVMNYPFRDAILSFVRYGHGGNLVDTVLSILENYPQPVVNVLMNCLSTHDVERAITWLVGEPLNGRDRKWQMAHHHLNPDTLAQGKRLFLLASVLQFFLPGVPSLYYGDEAGMTGYRDPFNRCTFPWGSMDQALHRAIQAISGTRAKHRKLLADAEFLPVCSDDNVIAFLRRSEEAALFIAVNRGGSPAPVLLPGDCEPLLGSLDGNLLPPYSYFVAEL